MQEADFRHLHVEFFIEAVPDPVESAKAGRPIFIDQERVRIRSAGDKLQVGVYAANAPSCVRDQATGYPLTYAELHRGPYEAFKKGIEFHGTGTPLSELPFLTEAQRKEMQALNVYTAEALAGLEGIQLTRLGMFGRQMKNQAQIYIDKAEKMHGINQLAAENEDLKARLERLEAKLSGQTEPSQKGQADGEPAMNTSSPFADWDGESIRTWLRENRGPTPGPNTSLAKLIQIADKHNAALKAEKEAA